MERLLFNPSLVHFAGIHRSHLGTYAAVSQQKPLLTHDQFVSLHFSGAKKQVYRKAQQPPRVNVEELKADFQKWSKKPPAAVTFGPNRVNLIGEHTDYNDGFVLPIALDIGTYAAVAPRKDRTVRIRTLNPQKNQPKVIRFDLDAKRGPFPEKTWGNYAKGTIEMVEDTFGIKVPGMDILIKTDGPTASGLSSSAAFETAVGLAALKMFLKRDLTEQDKIRLVLVGQKAEHNYAGVKCGIMDQAASGLCREGEALLLDCRPMGTENAPAYAMEHIPVNFPGKVFVVMDTLVARKLEKSEYTERRDQCEDAVRILKSRPGLENISALRDVDLRTFNQNKNQLPEMMMRRARHVVTENTRVQEAVSALKTGDYKAFGQFMNESHESLRQDYNVSSDHLNTLVQAARDAGAYGARLTGAGFGGCTVALIDEKNFDNFSQQVKKVYRASFGVEPVLYKTRASQGAHTVSFLMNVGLTP